MSSSQVAERVTRFCTYCGARLFGDAVFCIECGARQPGQVKVGSKRGAPAITSTGYLLVGPTGIYSAPLDRTRMLFRYWVKLLKLVGVVALAAIDLIGGLVLMFLYLPTASLLHIYG